MIGSGGCSTRRPAEAAESSLAKRQELFQAKVTAAANKLGKSLRPSDEQELGKIRLKLLNAGFRQEAAVAVYFGIKLIGMLIGLDPGRPVPGHAVWHDADGRDGRHRRRRPGLLLSRISW